MLDESVENTVSVRTPGKMNESLGIQLTSLHRLTASKMKQNDKAEPIGKKARPHTLWRLLEIDL